LRRLSHLGRLAVLPGFVAAAIAASSPVKIGFGHVPPITYGDANGQAAGFAADVLNEAARRAHITLQWVPSGTSQQVEDRLASGVLDLLPAAMVTPERQQRFELSEPWWFTELTVLTRSGSGVDSGSSLSGKRLGLASPIYRRLAAKAYPDARLIPFESAFFTPAVCRGEVDAALITHGDLHELLSMRPPGCSGVDLQSFDSQIVLDLALMARRGDADLVRTLRARIDEMALDGTLAQLAALHPPMPASGAVRLAAALRSRYERRNWYILVSSILALLGLSLWFIVRQRRIQRSLRLETELLQRVIDNIPVMIGICIPGTPGCTVNREFVRLLGRDPSVAARIDSEIGEAPEAGWRDLKLTGIDGTPIDTSWAKVVLSNGTQVALGIDVRERLRAEQSLREASRLESIGALAGGVAHDFNNILTVVTGNLSLVLDEPGASSETRANLSSALQACERAAGLTRQLLAYAGKTNAVRRPVSVSAVARDTIRLLRRSVAAQIEIRQELADDLPSIEIDPSQLQQVFSSLILNASEAIIDDRPGVITVRTALDEGGVRIEVEDNGCGMNEETRKRIFEPFFTTKFTGRGLGMAAVQGIVRSSNGRIAVESKAGEGTRVRVWLPGAAAEPMPPAQPTAPAGGASAVLIVDDEEAIRRMTAAILRKRGITVYEAGSGREAIECFRANRAAIRVMVLDLTMADLSGDEALPEIARLRPDLHVIVSSGHSDAEVRRHFTSPQCRAFLPKPYTGAQLMELILPALRD
jgi:signal transduction histidine kinase